MRLMSRAAVLLMSVMLFFTLGVTEVQAGNIYTSPYVTFSPDGQAWTTNAGDKEYTWYEKGTTVDTGIESTLRAAERGEHYYKAPRTGVIPVGEWKVVHRTGMCIHSDYPSAGLDWHGIPFGRKKCLNHYYSGWLAYCADCGDLLIENMRYMSREAAESISYLEIGTGMDYYYLCPWCSNLEMGVRNDEHKCRAISWNRYKVRYDVNTNERYGGYMADSIHMYNDETEYEGETVTPLKYLTLNTYNRIGYEFIGWNTMPDGSGTSYMDGARIWNLTDKNYSLGSAESEGVVTLYAMWKQSYSTLKLNLNGGSYNGEDSIRVTKKYMETYMVDDDKVTAPSGCKVFFQTNGGEYIAPIIASQHLNSWQMEQPFQGRFQNNEYLFLAPDGNEDILTAHYEPDAVELPEAVFSGKSFGGWYYDPEFQNPAGEAGDFITFNRDTTLYAQWVELRLWAKTDYEMNDGKGAVDLKWLQPDGKDKVYMVYQSRDGKNYTRVNSADDISNDNRIGQSYDYSKKSGTYVVPYSGFYILTAKGAAGGDYAQYFGGRGGRVTARVWLSKGELVTYFIGGKDGGNGGGSGSDFANGGGRTIISTNKKGVLLIAGGGGGAGLLGNGESGGSLLSLRKDLEWMGQDGQTGGGAGNVGGNAGELERHHHTQDCYREVDIDILTEYADYYTSYVYEYDDEENEQYIVCYGSSSKLIPTYGADTLDIELLQSMTYIHGYDGNNIGGCYLAVYNQSGECLFYKGGSSCEDYWVKFSSSYEFEDDEPYFVGEKLTWGPINNVCYWITKDDRGNVISQSTNHDFVPSYDAMENARRFGGTTFFSEGSPWFGSHQRAYKESIAIPPQTTGIYIISVLEANNRRANYFYQASLSGEERLVCGYEEGQIVSYKPAYGGSNYINTDYCSNYHSEEGVCADNGAVEILSEKIGFVSEMELKGVMAPDLEAPDEVTGEKVSGEAISADKIRLSWEAPKDNGTGYYHQVESYPAGTSVLLSRSNITYDVLTTGVKGYYYLVDGSSFTDVTFENAEFTQDCNRDVSIEKDVKYFHIAAVDRAGNISKTTHISLDLLQDDIQWRLYTEKLHLGEGENVYPAGEEDTYYVRSDGKTPFTLTYTAGMDGWPREDYWLKYGIFEDNDLEDEENAAKNVLTHGENELQEEVTYFTEGTPLLTIYPSTSVTWGEAHRSKVIEQKFILDSVMNGRKIEVIPVAGADYHGEMVYSEHDADKENGLVLIADGEAPVIYGIDNLELPELLDRGKGNVSVELAAEDALSGVADFYLKIVNQDNFIEKTYYPDEAGFIRVDITMDEPVFSGDFIMMVCAVDRVGNERIISFGTTEFALDARVEKIQSPHDATFRGGESGILKFSVWGYADYVEVEFPEEMLELNPELNQVFRYENRPSYCHEEELQFMVPLYTPENSSLTITVRAYKKDRQLEQHPAISIIGVQGTVLNDIRTRLR